MRSVEGVGHAEELGVGILLKDQLDHPPEWSAVGNVIVHASGHSGVQHGEPVAVAREDERARIAVVREVAGRLAVIVDDGLPGLES